MLEEVELDDDPVPALVEDVNGEPPLEELVVFAEELLLEVVEASAEGEVVEDLPMED